MKGYHYTSYENWLSIQKEGFIPYPINKPEVTRAFPDAIKAIWTWAERPTGESELGSILYQTATKQSTHIVLLEFDYDPSDLLSRMREPVVLKHDGTLGSWLYHKDQRAYLLKEAVPPENIRMVKDVNLLDLVPADLGVLVEDASTVDTHLA